MNRLIKKQIVKIDFYPAKKSLVSYFQKTGYDAVVSKNHVEIELDYAEKKLHNLIHPLFKQGFQIKDISIEKPNLEKVFIKISRGEK